MGNSLVATPSGGLVRTPTPWERLTAAWVASFGSLNTRKAYRRDVDHFAHWAAEHGNDPLLATRPVIDAYARSVDGERPATVARRLAALSSFFAYCLDEEVLDRNPLARVRRPRVAVESTALGLDRDQAVAFIRAAETAGPRDHLFACLLLFNGLRVFEAIALDLEHAEQIRGHTTVMIYGKRGREDRVVLPPPTCNAIEAVMAGEARTTGPMLLDGTGRRLNRHQGTRIVHRLARVAGIGIRIGPHSLRHTAVTLALDAGVSLRDVQDFARHADPRTTRRYDLARGALDRSAAYALASYLAD